MPMSDATRRISRRLGLGALAVAIIAPLALLGAMVIGKVWSTVDPPAAVKHADATHVTGYDVVATSKANLDKLVVNKIFLGPVVERPQDLIVAPDAALVDMGRPGPPDSSWLVYGDYPDDCHISVDRITGGEALRMVTELSPSQRDAVTSGQKLVLEMQFTCSQG
ncbi:hypothetical protein AB0H58_05885 [Nocardia neocaledoniensis]|uniref:hypothetical protein n=1 Tax=Nocardia neocaledoniensis TaxID=236511 RepID=UPI0033DE5061